MHDFIYFLFFYFFEILISWFFYEKMVMVVPFFWKNEWGMSECPSLQMDAWLLKTLIFEEKMISFFQNGLGMAECPYFRNGCMIFWKSWFFMKRWWWWFFFFFFEMDEAWPNALSSKINVSFEKSYCVGTSIEQNLSKARSKSQN